VGLLAPAKTPTSVVQRLNTELNAVLNDPVVKDKLQTLGIDASPGTAEQFSDQLKRDLSRYGPVVKSANIRLE